MDHATIDWWNSVSAALAVGQRFATSVDEFNLACDHIVQLLEDASTLLHSGSHSTAIFLAITAIEETAKTHIGSFRNSADAVKRSKDPLYQHREKHKIALSPTVLMGERLVKALGEERLSVLVELARNGQLVPIREASLYVSQSQAGLQSPSAAVSREQAREFLLLAVEVFDDSLVGISDYTFNLSVRTDKIFQRWEGAA